METLVCGVYESYCFIFYAGCHEAVLCLHSPSLWTPLGRVRRMKRRSDVCIHSLCYCPTVHHVSLGFTVAENRKTGGCVGLKYSAKSETVTGILTLCVKSSSSCWSVRTGTAKICMDHLNAISYHVVEEHLLGHYCVNVLALVLFYMYLK